MTRHPRAATVDRGWQRTRRAGLRWAAWGAVAGLVASTVAFAPASWLAAVVSQASGERLQLAAAEGSIWSGSAVPVLTGGPGSRDAAALPGRLHWRLAPQGLGLALDARHDCCLNGDLQLRLQWRPGTTTLAMPARADGLGQWPAAWLSGLGTPWNTLQLGGQLRLGGPGLTLRWSAGQLQLDGGLDLDLLDARSRLSSLPTLGSYRFSVRGQDGGSALSLQTLDGVLRLSGSGQWTGQRLQFRGQAEAAADSESALSNLLNIIGRRQGALSIISIG